MRRWRRLVAGTLEALAAALVIAAAGLLWGWRAPALAAVPLALTVLLLGARLWALVAWRLADRKLAAQLESGALGRWSYGPDQWRNVLDMLRRVSGSGGGFKRWLAGVKYREETGVEQSVVILETGIVFGGTDWWRWDRVWRLGGVGLFRPPEGTATLLVQLRPRVPLSRWQERDIFAGPQLTLAIPVPPGEEERAGRIASYLERRRG